MKKRKINIDVRSFSVPSPLTGSIESNSGFGGIPLSGQEIHKIIQKKKSKNTPNYIPEKHMSMSLEKGAYEFVVGGRADGVINEEHFIIEELKSAFDVEALRDLLLQNYNHPYRWQIRTYGYIHYRETGKIPTLILELVSSRNFKTIQLSVDLDVDSYEEWLERRLLELESDTKIKEKIYDKRIKIAKEMPFPFPRPRPGQLELVNVVRENFEEGSALLLEAPTGLGKTAGVLYPALKESLTRGQKTIFVTPKNSQHKLAEDAVKLMQKRDERADLNIRCLTITSKSKMCLKAETLCNPVYCEYARNYYDKLDQHDLVSKLGKVKRLTSKKLKALAEEYTVCPFELSLEAIDRAEVIIADYNYVFSPRSLIGRLTEPLIKTKEKPNLVIDEAHNLPSRAQDYFSPAISVGQLEQVEHQMSRVLSDRFLDDAVLQTQNLKDFIQNYGKEGSSRKISIDVDVFQNINSVVRDLVSRYLESDVEIISNDPILKLSNLVSNFSEALELSGDEFFQTYQKTWNDELLKITCCDASAQLKLAYKEFKNTAAFSATLKPFTYYQQLMGFPDNKTKTYEFDSPFLQANRKIMVIPQISTKYKDRNFSAPKIIEVIEKILAVKPGNYLALFPSFEFMNMVAAKLKISGHQILVQQKEMKLHTISQYLDELKNGITPTIILGVQGGVFSEGVDYPGEMLIGAFVVGPALPNFDFEREQIRAYYEKRYGAENAFDYAYVYPAMAKAIQSAGRVMRTETDRGVIILIDPRFLEKSYYQTMPATWFHDSPKELVSGQILQDIKTFWENTL